MSRVSLQTGTNNLYTDYSFPKDGLFLQKATLRKNLREGKSFQTKHYQAKGISSFLPPYYHAEGSVKPLWTLHIIFIMSF